MCKVHFKNTFLIILSISHKQYIAFNQKKKIYNQILTDPHDSSMTHWTHMSYICQSPGLSPDHCQTAPWPAGELCG